MGRADPVNEALRGSATVLTMGEYREASSGEGRFLADRTRPSCSETGIGVVVGLGEKVVDLELNGLAPVLVDHELGFARGFEEDEGRALDRLARVVVDVQATACEAIDEG